MLEINTGSVMIPIKRDGEDVGSISFNPSDIAFIENLYALLGKLEAKQQEYAKKGNKLDTDTRTDENGVPLNTQKKLALYRESCEYIRSEIDLLFGENTASTVFGSANNFEVFVQFLSGVLPYVQEERDKKVSKYLNRKQKRAAGLK